MNNFNTKKIWLEGHQKQIFTHKIESHLARLELQKTRAQAQKIEHNSFFLPQIHDVDYYLILLRRLYRMIEKCSKNDARVANLKGKYTKLVKNIRIRDHFEHDIDPYSLPRTSTKDLHCITSKQDIVVATSLIGSTIVSGKNKWDLNTDHIQFIKLVKEFQDLYPYNMPKSTLGGKFKKRLAKMLMKLSRTLQ